MKVIATVGFVNGLRWKRFFSNNPKKQVVITQVIRDAQDLNPVIHDIARYSLSVSTRA